LHSRSPTKRERGQGEGATFWREVSNPLHLYRMRHTPLAIGLREARQRASLTQAALAAKAGISRVTLARFESGADQDIRVGSLGRLSAPLKLELALVPSGVHAALETRLARAEERRRRADRRAQHAALAAHLLSAPGTKARALIARARESVDRWERDRLCSSQYISRWRTMLTGTRERVARALLRRDAWADALFQNSPWAFALEAPEP
jgi:transcriptional regulator with XRE-family HTH domain